MFGGKLRTLLVEVKANSARLSELQKLGPESYAKNILFRFADYSLTPSAQSAKAILERMIKNKEPIRGVIFKADWQTGLLKEIWKVWKK